MRNFTLTTKKIEKFTLHPYKEKQTGLFERYFEAN